MTSALQQPRHARDKTPRRFVGFPFRLQPNPQPGGQRDVRRLDRQVMCKGEDERLDGVEPGVQLACFLHLGRSRVVRCDVSFDDAGSNDTQVLVPSLTHACVTGFTGDR